MVASVVPHDPAWAGLFCAEARSIAAAFQDAPIVLHHIGSTAVPGIVAKPIIDILGEVPDLGDADANAQVLTDLGYEAMGAYGIEGRRYFRKSNRDGVRTHHLHIFANGSAHLERHLAFRDYLIAHPDVAAEYSALKEKLTGGGATPWDSYLDGKDAFVKSTEKEALTWYG